MDWTDYTRFSITLFALINPFTKIPFTLSSAGNSGARAILVMAASSTITMIVLLTTMHWAGEKILLVLGTSLPSFQIGGGLVILLSGLALLTESKKQDAVQAHTSDFDRSNFVKIGVSPLGIPMLAGAAAIAKVISEAQPGYGVENSLHLDLMIALVCVTSGAIIASSAILFRVLGPAFFSVMSRLAGLIVVSVAIEVMWHGVSAHVVSLVAQR